MNNLKITKIDFRAQVPERTHATDAGLDLRALEDITINPGQTTVVRTGLAIKLPENTEGQIRPRSGLSIRSNLRVVLGTIDESYTGELKIIAENKETKIGGDYLIRAGDRIAQLIINPIVRPEIEVVESLEETDRSDKGFGSSGVE